MPRIGRTTRRRRAAVPGALSALVAAALLGALAPSIPAAPGAPASVAGATTITAGVHGTYAHPGAGELWGGTNPDENCVSCTVTGLLALNPAQSVAPGQPVDPVTGDYSTQDTLFSVPATYGTLGVTLTYDAQRAIAQAKKPATYPYATGGAAGAGWTSSLTSSATLKNDTVTINERTGAQVFFYELGTSATQHDADGCKVTGKPGLYADFQKFTVPRTKTPTTPTGPTAKYVTGSTIAFCAARRVNAQLGYISAFGGYELRSQGGATVALYSSTYGELLGYSNSVGDLRGGRTIKLSYYATTPALHCGTEGETKCIVETDTKTGRTVKAEVNASGDIFEIWDPMGAQYHLTHTTATAARLTAVSDNQGETTSYAYQTGGGFNDELTTVTSPTGGKTHLTYTAGMVTSVTDPMGHATTYGYGNKTCATTTPSKDTCLSAQQFTTVSEADGQYDTEEFTQGLLRTSCVGSAGACGSLGSWEYSYTNAKTGSMTETVHLETTYAKLTYDPAGKLAAYTAPHPSGASPKPRHYMYNDTGGNVLDELCWAAGPTVAVPGTASCTRPPSGSWHYGYSTQAKPGTMRPTTQAGELLAATDPLGDTTHYGYYKSGLLCWVAPPAATVKTTRQCTASTGASVPSTAKVPSGATTYAYTAKGEVSAKTVDGGTTTYEYDTDGRVTYSIPPDGQGSGAFGANPYETATGYNAVGEVLTVHAPKTDKSSYTYNAAGQVATETDPGGVTTTAYDQDGRVCWTLRAPAAVTDPSCASPPSGARVENGYLATTTAPTSVTDPTGKTTTYKYTDHYFPTKPTFVTDPMHKAVVSTSYNEFGDACVTGPVSHPATTCNWAAGDTMEAMDALGQLTTQKDPTGVVTSSTYATATYPTEPTQVAYAGKTTTYAYDKDGRRVKVTEPGGTVVMTAYSADSQACWSGPTTASSVTCTSPLSYGDSTYAHDAGGRLTQMATDTGSTVTFAYTYDASGKLTETTKNGALTVGYAYNAAGEASCVAYPLKPTSSCSGAPGATNTVVDRTYDAAGQLTSVTDWLGNTTSFSSYTPQGQVGAVSYPTSTAESVAYSYDPSGSLTKAAYAGPVVGSKNDTFSYNTDGLLRQETLLGSFSAPTDTYNSYAQVTKATDPTGSGAAQDAYKVTPDGKLSSITPATGTATSFGYNATQELTSRVVGTTTTHFGYDPNGERCWKSATATASTCASAPSHATDYGWNALGELCWSGTSNSTTPCTRPQSADTSYTYGGNGLRLTETDPGTSTTPHRQFSWDTVSGGGTPLVISDGTSAYIYGPSMFGGSAPVEQITTGRATFLASVPSGVQLAFASTGSLYEQATYSTFGVQALSAGTTHVTPFGFQGGYTDPSGLVYFVNRYYTPQTAQFLSVDPMVTATGEPYAFATGDPLNATDPLGTYATTGQGQRSCNTSPTGARICTGPGEGPNGTVVAQGPPPNVQLGSAPLPSPPAPVRTVTVPANPYAAGRFGLRGGTVKEAVTPTHAWTDIVHGWHSFVGGLSKAGCVVKQVGLSSIGATAGGMTLIESGTLAVAWGGGVSYLSVQLAGPAGAPGVVVGASSMAAGGYVIDEGAKMVANECGL